MAGRFLRQPCWSSAAKVLESELLRLQSSWPPMNSLEVQGELAAVLFVMTKLSTRFPLLSEFCYHYDGVVVV